MKIEKLYTLSQFVDLVLKKQEESILPSNIYLGLIAGYNYFLKQPLSKEMFISPYDDGSIVPASLGEAEKAEKKVIFDNFNYCDSSTDYHNKGVKTNAIFEHSGKICIITLPKYNEYDSICVHYQIKTLHDLAEATKGELKLKNVEL